MIKMNLLEYPVKATTKHPKIAMLIDRSENHVKNR